MGEKKGSVRNNQMGTLVLLAWKARGQGRMKRDVGWGVDTFVWNSGEGLNQKEGSKGRLGNGISRANWLKDGGRTTCGCGVKQF